MDRRRALKSGAIAAGAAGMGLLEEGCAHQPSGLEAAALSSLSPLPDPRVIEQVVTSMDQRLAWIDRQEMAPDLARLSPPPSSPQQQAHVERYQRLFRQSMRTLYVTGRFMDLPDEIKTHPDVQARVLGAQAEMDEAVFGTTELLDTLRPEDHRMLQATLRAQPDLGERLAKMMDEPARDDGIPFGRRLSLRTTTMALTDRMRAQSPALTIDPLVRRVRKVAARPHTGSGTTRLMAAKMGEEAFWQHQQRLADLSARWERTLAQAAPAPGVSPAPAAAPPWSSPAPTPAPQKVGPARGTVVPVAAPSGGHRAVSTGGYVMGFGLGSVGVGAVFAGLYSATSVEAFLWPALIFGFTVGPILLIVGLLIVIAGGIAIAAE